MTPEQELPVAASATERLEAALDRIGQAAASAMIRAGREGEQTPNTATAELAARLDDLIARVRAALEDG